MSALVLQSSGNSVVSLTDSDRLMSACFAEFYDCVATLAEAARNGTVGRLLGVGEQGSDVAAAAAARLHACLDDQLKNIEQEANQMERSAYGLARYLFVALADEVLALELDWVGRDAWNEHLLERTLFGRTVAGRDFYLVTDRILDARGRNPLMLDLAVVALNCLQLGFQGALRGADQQPARERYRRRLLQYIGFGQQAADQPLFADAYQGAIQQADEQRLAPFRPWLRAVAVVAVGYLLISGVVWNHGLLRLAVVLPQAPSTLSTDH